MKKVQMLCLGPKKSLSSPRLKLMAQGMVQCTKDQSRVWYHSAIQAPQKGNRDKFESRSIRWKEAARHNAIIQNWIYKIQKFA